MKFLTLFSFCLFLLACTSNPQDKAIADIKALESNKSFQKSDTLINSYIHFSENYPTHKLAPLFLFKAAQACVKSNKGLKGTRLYEKMALSYEQDSLAPEALIRGGVGYQAASDPANALRLYNIFLEKYPQHPRYNEVKRWTEIIGLSEEELMRRFQMEFLNNSDSTKQQ